MWESDELRNCLFNQKVGTTKLEVMAQIRNMIYFLQWHLNKNKDKNRTVNSNIEYLNPHLFGKKLQKEASGSETKSHFSSLSSRFDPVATG